jgi:NAD(P)-dependent dehydrogenase (short-subunit alcohol dehydrogenase family)
MGRAAALTFAREGASVVGCDVSAEPAQETVTGRRQEMSLDFATIRVQEVAS